MTKFNYVDYLEKVRMENGINQVKLAEIIGCSASNYSNKVFRESFSFEEIVKICDYLDINLESLKLAISLDDPRVSEMMEDLKYSGNNNYNRNKRGFKVAEKILDNDVALSSLDKNIKFNMGYRMIVVAPNHNGYGIHDAETYFHRIFGGKEKVDLDVLSGMFFACLYKLSSKYEIYLYPKHLYLPRILEYMLDAYNCDNMKYILKIIDEKTPLSSSVYVFIPECSEFENASLGLDCNISNSDTPIDILNRFMRSIIGKKVNDKTLEYEFEKFLLKIHYIKEIYYKE